MSDRTAPVYRAVFQIEVFTVGPYDPYAEMDHYDGDEAHTDEGRPLPEILADTYQRGVPSRYYQVASHPVPDTIGEWAEAARENANALEMAYGYRDGVPYGDGGEDPVESVTGIVDLTDLWRHRRSLRGGQLRTCTCGNPIKLVEDRWEHLFNSAVIDDPPSAHDPKPTE